MPDNQKGHPSQRVSQFLGTIPTKHGGGNAGTGNPSRCPLLPSSQLPGFLLELGAVCSAGFLKTAGPPAKHISAALGWLQDLGTRRDVFEENILLKIQRLSLAWGCCQCSASHEKHWISDFPGSLSGLIRNWAEVTKLLNLCASLSKWLHKHWLNC